MANIKTLLLKYLARKLPQLEILVLPCVIWQTSFVA